MLSDSHFSHIIVWMPHGRAWRIVDKENLISNINKYFALKRFHSFIRQLSGWGFKRLRQPGPDHGCYYHEFFLRGIPRLTWLMRRVPTNPGKPVSHIKGEPNFYEIAKKHPLPPVTDDHDVCSRQTEAVVNNGQSGLNQSTCANREFALLAARMNMELTMSQLQATAHDDVSGQNSVLPMRRESSQQRRNGLTLHDEVGLINNFQHQVSLREIPLRMVHVNYSHRTYVQSSLPRPSPTANTTTMANINYPNPNHLLLSSTNEKNQINPRHDQLGGSVAFPGYPLPHGNTNSLSHIRDEDRLVTWLPSATSSSLTSYPPAADLQHQPLPLSTVSHKDEPEQQTKDQEGRDADQAQQDGSCVDDELFNEFLRSFDL